VLFRSPALSLSPPGPILIDSHETLTLSNHHHL
jgi:hypothetical protein